MTLNEAIERYTSNAEYERIHGNLQGCLDFRQLAEWLKDYKRLLKQEPKTGHWEWMPYDDNPKLGDWHCSECRCVVVECVYKNEKRGIPLYKYCPQCGIKMGEPQESEDLGDYPDTIRNQFDNMTGSMNL